MNLRAIVFARHLGHAAVGIVPVVVGISQVGVFDKSHVGVRAPAVVFVGTVKVQVANGSVVQEFHIHAIANPLVADMVCPELIDMLRRCSDSFKAITAFNQMRVHVVNAKVAVNMVPGTFVTAHSDSGTAQVRAAAHAHQALVCLGGNPVFPLLQIFAFLHNRNIVV